MNSTLLPSYILQDPEVVAMLQAFYSRSAMPIETRVEELGTDLHSIKESLKKWYIGYNHDSIGDCGNAPIFFEGVSMLFAKALQDNPLYNGQETSTRFTTYSSSSLIEPNLSSRDFSAAKDIQSSWMQFYEDTLSITTQRLQETLPHSDHLEVTEKVWEASIKARAFDIMRAFLPAGTTTQLSFYGSLRNLRDSLSNLALYPLTEVSEVATQALAKLTACYPSAFAAPKYSEEQEYFITDNKQAIFYNFASIESVLSEYPLINKDLEFPVDDSYQRQLQLKWRKVQTDMSTLITENYFSLPDYAQAILNKRPKGKTVPYSFGRFGSFKVDFLLDYGSFRDIQRHRNCKMPLPVLTDFYGFHPWYLNQLRAIDSDLYLKALDLIDTNKQITKSFSVDSLDTLLELQYIHPMGMMVPVEVTMALDEMVYISELRSSKTVHPTLRPVAQSVGRFLNAHNVPVYIDESPDAFVPYRGKQDITKR